MDRILISFAPVNEVLCGLTAADAGFTEAFFTERHAAGGNFRNFLELQLTFEFTAPHCTDEAGLVLCDGDHFVEIVDGVGHGLTAFQRCIVECFVELCEDLRNFGLQFIKGNEILLTVVAANEDALVVGNVLRTEFQTQRNTLHFILCELPAGRVVGIVDLCADEGVDLVCDFVCLVKNAFLVLLDGTTMT